MLPPSSLTIGIPSGGDVKTVALLLLAVTGAVGVEPDRAAMGEPLTVTGPPGGAVVLEALDTSVAPVLLGTIGADGRLAVRVPDVPQGSYRVAVAGESEAPVLEVTALSQGTSLALVVSGLLFMVVLLVGGVVVHRRWRDAIS
jgi:hypothetical protein